MALSQIQCLNEHHVNLRTNESKPEFLYSEEQRLALEMLLDEGPDCFQKFIKTYRIRPFLSDLELAQLSASVEPYRPDLPDYPAGFDGDSKEARLSLQYWPECSEDTLPQLELGWPQCASYRGVTRVTVHAQPPLHGDAHIKEIIRRTIAQAQKVIAVVMDLFTDVDIFQDLLHASFKRNVAVYIILEVTGVPHFLKMCESASMHTGHLKNLRVRSIRGTGFYTHSSKKVGGTQSQKFMFVDGDKAVSGSYSFTWTASRLDRSIITVLTGQAVELFDQLFQDLYMMSNAVNLNKIKMEKEQKLEPISKPVPALPRSTTIALKLINPKYSLVSCNATANSNHVDSARCTANSNSIKQMKEVPDGPRIHPGLLHLEKANMIDYLPVWPEPDPPRDVIGFINIRDCSKPIQAHPTRSELFEVSQAIRFKDPIHVPQESLSEKDCPRPTSPADDSANEQPLMQPQTTQEENNKHCNSPQKIHPPSSLNEQVVCLSPTLNPKPGHSSKKDEKDSPVDHGMEKQADILSKQREEMDAENIIASTSAESCKDSQISEDPQIDNITPYYSVGSNTVTTHTSVTQPETTSDKQSCEDIAESTSDKDIHDNQWSTHKLIEPDTNETDHADSPIHSEESTYSDSSSCFSAEENFECGERVIVDSEIVGLVNRMPLVSMYPDEPNTVGSSSSSSSSSLMSGSCKIASSHEVMKETEESRLQSASPGECDGQHLTGMRTDISSDLEFTSMNGGNGLSESVSLANQQQVQETDSPSQQGTENKPLRQVKTDAQEAPDENTECLQECESYSVVNHIFELQPVEESDSAESQLSENTSLLQDEVAVPMCCAYVPVLKTAEAQCIVFSDTANEVPLLRLKPESCSGFTYTSNLKSVLEVNEDTHSTPQSKPASLNNDFQKGPDTERSHEEACKLPFQIKPLIAGESNLEQATEVKDTDSSNSEPKESATAQIVDKAQQLKLKTLTGIKIGQFSVDIYPLKRMTLEHMCVQQENKNQSEEKPKLERNFRKLHQVSPQPNPIPTCEVKLSLTKASVTKLHSIEHHTTSAVSTPGAQNYPPGRQLGQNKAANDLHASPAKLPRRHAAPIRSNQTQLRPLQTELSADHHNSSPEQP
ncbi:protein FAM83G [Pangasianodon hypophthalmus]|uniref:protein FAM83G n=1 Tax=Pangasianodon hypophthalmus TaxID=310915 RepID=UPI0023074241|nr:protein FAM83G [Pangasianodon hypophthalmus]